VAAAECLSSLLSAQQKAKLIICNNVAVCDGR
jgi:hypothetical protein